MKNKRRYSILLIVIFIVSLINSIKVSAVSASNIVLSGAYQRPYWGSNYWATSNLREWLNSSQTIVGYTNQKPSSDKVGNYAYDQEAGFLNSFTQMERDAIAVTQHRVNIESGDTSVGSGGTTQILTNLMPRRSVTFSMPGLITDWQSYYYQNVKDKVYLLSPYELYLYVQKRGYSLNKVVTNAVKSKYNYLNGSIPWLLGGGGDNIGSEYTFRTSETSAVQVTQPNTPNGIVPAVNLKPDYLLRNGKLAKDLVIGETVTFGKHLGEDITWRVVNKVDGYPLLITENVIDIKTLDAPGDSSYAYSEYINFTETAIDRSNPVYVNPNGSDINPPIITITNEDQLKVRQNGSFSISLQVTDDTAVDYIILPNGNRVSTPNFNYTIGSNGEYLFIACDTKGNYRYFIVPVGNINVPPSVQINSSANGWTNKDVTVDIKASNDVGLSIPSITQSNRDWSQTAWSNYTSYMNKRIHITGSVELVSADKPVGNYSAGVGVWYQFSSKSSSEFTMQNTWYSPVRYRLDYLQANGKQNFDFILTVPSNYFQNLAPWLQIDVPSQEKGYTVKWSNLNYEFLDNDDFAITKIILPSGQEIYQSSYTDTLKTEGAYTYKVVDSRGMTTEKTINVLIDKTLPTLDVQGVPTQFTKDDVVLSVNVSDTLSGLASLKLPNGSTTTSNTATFNVRSNGSYTFQATDSAGNTVTKTVVVDKIDKVVPTLNLTPSTTAITSNDVIISASANDGTNQSGIKQVKLPNGTIVNGGTATYTATTNGTYVFETTDNAGNITTVPITISNIDDISPVITLTKGSNTWSNSSMNIIVSVSDNLSGVKQIILPNGNVINGSSAIYVVSDVGVYYFEATDNVGNSTTSYIVIDNIDKSKPTVNISNNQNWSNQSSIPVSITAQDK